MENAWDVVRGGRKPTVEQSKLREAWIFAEANGISREHARELIELAELQDMPVSTDERPADLFG